MNNYFFDSSALVKRYVTEAGSGWVSSLINPTTGNHIFIMRIAAVEVVSAIVRRQRAGNLSVSDMSASLTRFRSELATIYLPVEVSQNLVSNAMALAESHALRGYDAVQLTAALEVYSEHRLAGLTLPTFISADAALNTAAVAEGLSVDNPNVH
ncbi:MAG: hypothetical protein AUG51_17295 [Acidobacteria bacterium 13_1_20CM_3_53_8]|nr:MAG: hypothetical protein AUG51_17295 [Acidobacteria bacterium 13_1_20CM_3_53_8]